MNPRLRKPSRRPAGAPAVVPNGVLAGAADGVSAGALAVVPVLLLTAGLSGCNREPSEASTATALPNVDLCRLLDRKAAENALLGTVTGCMRSGDAKGGYVTTFTGSAALRPGTAVPASLTIVYGARYDVRSGMDRWAELGTVQGTRVALIGLGDGAAFDPWAAPRAQLVALKGNLVLSIGLQTTGAPVPQEQLPDHLLELGRGTLDALSTPAAGGPGERSPR